jgi:hypothetical protein
VYIDSNLHDTLGYGWGLLAESKRSSWNAIIGVLRLLDDVDYFIVMAIVDLISTCVSFAWLA